MNAQEFTELYIRKESDEKLTPFQNEIGFSLIRLYPKNKSYSYKLRMFIKIAILKGNLFYSVDMTEPEVEEEKTSYTIVDYSKYDNKVTSFTSSADDKEFIFDQTKKKIVHNKTNKELTVNEFIDILVKNHLSDKLFWKRKINYIVNIILKSLFWFVNKHYEKIRVSIDRYNFSRENKSETKEEIVDSEPFFNYFHISKNLIFIILLITFIIKILSSFFPKQLPLGCIWNSLFGEFSLSNPIVFLFFFIVLFSLEKLSIWLNNNIKNFMKPDQNVFSEHKENFIEKLHNYQHNNQFNLKV